MLDSVISKIKELMASNFTGELRISLYRGGISKNIKVVNTQKLKDK